MASYQDQKHVLLQLLKTSAGVAEANGHPGLAQELRSEASHLNGGELHVVICGECKRGKSSLLNAFLEDKEICPPDAPVATNALTFIRYGEVERFQVHLENGEAEPSVEVIGRHQIRDYVTEQGNARNKRRTLSLEAWLPHPKLKDGLVLVDTPGVGSLNIEHTEATYRIIPYADAVILAGSATEPLSKPELEFCQRILKHTGQLLHVLTKRDLSRKWMDMLESNRRKLAGVMNLKETDVRAVAVSSMVKEEYTESGDPELLEESGFLDLERELWGLLKGRSGILLTRAIARALAVIAQMRFPLQMELSSLVATSESELSALDQQIQQRLKRAEELSSESSFWTGELRLEVDNLTSESLQRVADHFAQVRHALGNYLQIDAYVKAPQRLAEMLTTDINNAMAVELKTLSARLDEIKGAARQKTALLIEGGAAELHLSTAIEIGRLRYQGESWTDKTVTAGRTLTMTAGGVVAATSATGAIVGGVIGSIWPGAGTVIGAKVGAYFGAQWGSVIGPVLGIKKSITTVKERDMAGMRQELERTCREQVATAERSIGLELGRGLRTCASEIQTSMLREIQKDQKACKDAAAAVMQVRQLKSTESTQRQLQLRNALRQLDAMENQLRAIHEGAAA